MNCASCSAPMTSMTLDAHLSSPVDVDLCTACHGFWFDKYESLKLAPGSTLKLIKLIGECCKTGKPSLPKNLQCPRCNSRLLLTHDMQRNTRFTYWRCDNGHGRFITFFDFLREKNFIRPLAPQEIEELRKSVQVLDCSNCGAPIDITSDTDCSHCGSPLSILDMKQPQQLLQQLRQAAEPRPIDPMLPFELEFAKRHIETLSGTRRPDSDWGDDPATGLVEAGLNAVARWLAKSGI